MFESLHLNQVTERPAEAPEAERERHRRPWLVLAYLSGGVAVCLAWLVTRLVSTAAADSFALHVVQPYGVLGLAIFGGRAVLRERLRWCHACHRWFAMEWRGERVLRRRPIVQHKKTFSESFNPQGKKVAVIRQHTTSRGVRETVAVDQVCRHCGAKRTFRERRDR